MAGQLEMTKSPAGFSIGRQIKLFSAAIDFVF